MSKLVKSNILNPWMRSSTWCYNDTPRSQLLIQWDQLNTDTMVTCGYSPWRRRWIGGGDAKLDKASSSMMIKRPAVSLFRSDLQNGVTTASIFCDARSHHGFIISYHCHRPSGSGDHWMYHRHLIHAQACPLGSLLGVCHLGRQWSLSCLRAGYFCSPKPTSTKK